MLWTVVGFAVSTALCATVDSLAGLLFYRVLQGVFGAPMMPVAQSILLATYPDEDRAWSQTLFGIVTVVGQAMAPVIGGYFAEVFDWRWAFLFLMPLSVIAMVMAFAWIPQGGKTAGSRLDWPGFLALSIAIMGLQLTIDRGERLDWFESREIIIYASAAILSFYLFLYRTFTYRDPYINRALVPRQELLVGVGVNSVVRLDQFCTHDPISVFARKPQRLSRIDYWLVAGYAWCGDAHWFLSWR